jgi:hypothetical protein
MRIAQSGMLAAFLFATTLGRTVMAQQLDGLLTENESLITKDSASNYIKRVLEPLNDPATIVEIQAEFYRPASRRAPISRFVIPDSFHREIIAAFREPEIDRNPLFSVQETGSLRLKDRDGNFSTILIYGGLKSPLKFSISGVRCTATKRSGTDYVDESSVLESIVRRSYDAKSVQ